MSSATGTKVTIVFLVMATLAIGLASDLQAQQSGPWHKKQVDWTAGTGGRVKSVHYPGQDSRRLWDRRPAVYGASVLPTANRAADPTGTSLPNTATEETSALLYDVNSPPIAGFVPWIAVAITDARNDELELDAVPQSGVSGNYLTSEPGTAYAIGIFDTGAAAHILSAEGAARVGLWGHEPPLVTANSSVISGVTGEATTWVSKPLALFIDGLGAIDGSSSELDPSAMFGETNVAIDVGDPVASPYVPTVIGTPLSVYCTAAIRNDHPVGVAWNGNAYSGPDIVFFANDDPDAPHLPNQVPLELRPADVYAVQYTPNLNLGNIDDILDWLDLGFDEPSIPSIITNGLTSGQSLFFLSSVDLTHRGKTATEKTKFILDTGAQVSVISKGIAARLRLDPGNPEFEVDIQGVNGQSIMAPGFIIDLIEIPGLPQWLTFRGVPVIVLDVSSPEGGIFDGIIGMNLFTDFNLVFHGGGMFLQDPPSLEFERIRRFIPADVVPDGVVDMADLLLLAQAWLSEPGQEPWNPLADMAPLPSGDGRVDFLDFALLASCWGQVKNN